jgi:hypothetical protein
VLRGCPGVRVLATSREPLGLAGETDLRAAVERLITRATDGLTPDELASTLPRAASRLDTNDFRPHNLLFGDGGLTVVDVEGAGWDDPARMVMGFVAHAGSEGLPPPAGCRRRRCRTASCGRSPSPPRRRSGWTSAACACASRSSP